MPLEEVDRPASGHRDYPLSSSCAKRPALESPHDNSDAIFPEDVLVIGESLIDIMRSSHSYDVEMVGGSPANVALGLGRLGDAPRLVTALGNDSRGRKIADHLERSGVVIDPASWSLARTGTATATILRDGRAEYELDIEWKLPAPIELGTARVVHTGSIATFLAPGAHAIVHFIDRIAGQAKVTFDPNVRAAVVGAHATALNQVLTIAARADVVKLSDEDAGWLWPSLSPDQVVDTLIQNGSSLVALTLGGDGAIAATRSARVRVAAPPVAVVDTVGAGDTFMAALIHRLVENPALAERPSPSALTDLVQFAVTAAALTVQRTGADLPSASDVRSASKPSRSTRD